MKLADVSQSCAPYNDAEVRYLIVDGLAVVAYGYVPFSRKIQMLEEMEEVARAFHGPAVAGSPDEHEERTTL